MAKSRSWIFFGVLFFLWVCGPGWIPGQVRAEKMMTVHVFQDTSVSFGEGYRMRLIPKGVATIEVFGEAYLFTYPSDLFGNPLGRSDLFEGNPEEIFSDPEIFDHWWESRLKESKDENAIWVLGRVTRPDLDSVSRLRGLLKVEEDYEAVLSWDDQRLIIDLFRDEPDLQRFVRDMNSGIRFMYTPAEIGIRVPTAFSSAIRGFKAMGGQ